MSQAKICVRDLILEASVLVTIPAATFVRGLALCLAGFAEKSHAKFRLDLIRLFKLLYLSISLAFSLSIQQPIFSTFELMLLTT